MASSFTNFPHQLNLLSGNLDERNEDLGGCKSAILLISRRVADKGAPGSPKTVHSNYQSGITRSSGENEDFWRPSLEGKPKCRFRERVLRGSRSFAREQGAAPGHGEAPDEKPGNSQHKDGNRSAFEGFQSLRIESFTSSGDCRAADALQEGSERLPFDWREFTKLSTSSNDSISPSSHDLPRKSLSQRKIRQHGASKNEISGLDNGKDCSPKQRQDDPPSACSHQSDLDQHLPKKLGFNAPEIPAALRPALPEDDDAFRSKWGELNDSDKDVMFHNSGKRRAGEWPNNRLSDSNRNLNKLSKKAASLPGITGTGLGLGGGELMILLARFEDALESCSASNEVNGRWCEARRAVDKVVQSAELARGEIEEAAILLKHVENYLRAAPEESKFPSETLLMEQLPDSVEEADMQRTWDPNEMHFFLNERLCLTVEYVQHLLGQADSRLVALQADAQRVKEAKHGFMDAVSRSEVVWLENVARASGELEALLRVILPMEFAFWSSPSADEVQ